MKKLIRKALKNRRHQEDGFAIIDALIAVSLMALGLLSAVEFISAMYDMIITQKMEIVAYQLATNTLEEMDANDGADYNGSLGYTDISGKYNTASVDEGDYGAFQYKYSGNAVFGGYATEITVTVKFVYKDKTREISLTSISTR